MPFGLSNAPAAFQRAMDELFYEEKKKFVQVYFDAIIIFSQTKEDHEIHLREVISKLKKAGLVLKRKKRQFFKSEVIILGYQISKNKISPATERIEHIHDFSVLNTRKGLKFFFGLLSYCRNFIEDLSAKSAPLNALLKGSSSPQFKVQLLKDEPKVFL